VTSRRIATTALVLALGLAAACRPGSPPPSSTPPTTGAPSAADAKAFLDNVDATLKKISVEANQAGWVAQNFITVDTGALDARMSQIVADTIARWAKESVKFDNVTVPAEQRRQLNLLKLSLVLATPSDPQESQEVTRLVTTMRGTYGKGKWCADPTKPDACMNIDDVT
jgi:peptidyl-dipeptidase A